MQLLSPRPGSTRWSRWPVECAEDSPCWHSRLWFHDYLRLLPSWCMFLLFATVPIQSSEFFCISKEAIGQDENVHRCCDKRCKEKKRWLVPHYAEQQFIDGGDDEKHEGHCRDPSEREQRSLEQSLSSGLK